MEGFGLAAVKVEGTSVRFGTDGDQAAERDYKPDLSRWIELRYDPKDDVCHLPVVETVRQIIDAEIIKGKLSKDDVDLMITSLANIYIDSRGF